MKSKRTLIAGLCLLLLVPGVTWASTFDDAMRIVEDPKELATRSAEAERLFRQTVASNAAHVDAWYNLGLILAQRGDTAGAEDAWRRALAARADHLPSKAQLAGLALARGETARAVETLEGIIGESRFQPEARNLLAAHAIARQDYDGAILHARNVLLGDPRNVNALLNAAIAYYHKGLYDQAGLIAESGLDRQPEAAALRNVMGLVYLARDNTRRATEEFLAALESDPGNMDARLNLAALELAYGNFDSSLRRLDAALEVRRNDPMIVLSRGVALRGLERFAEAQEAYERALALNPGLHDAEYNLCVLHHQFTEQWQEARRWCSRYLGRIDATHPRHREVERRVRAVETTIMLLESEAPPPLDP